jgi:hypothetical protein
MCPANSSWTRSCIVDGSCRNRCAALEIDALSAPTLNATTPLIVTGMPWVVTQLTGTVACLRSSDSVRALWMTGQTNTRLPDATILYCWASAAPSPPPRLPETISASFGSAILNPNILPPSRFGTLGTLAQARSPRPGAFGQLGSRQAKSVPASARSFGST